MSECVIDTHVLADLLKQFDNGKPNRKMIESKFLTKNITEFVNSCISSDGLNGIVVASSFAFIEIINQFDKISAGFFTLAKLTGVLSQPPSWFVVEPFSKETSYSLISIPKLNKQGDKIELADAIHVATAMQRGPGCYLATHDGSLKELDFNSLNLKHLL